MAGDPGVDPVQERRPAPRAVIQRGRRARVRPLISLGDAIRAVDRLDAKGSTAREIADLLAVRDPMDTGLPAQAPIFSKPPSVETEGPAPESDAVPPAGPSQPSRSTRQVVSSTLREVPGSAYAGIRTDPLPRQGSMVAETLSPIEPLLRPGWARAILSAALSTDGDAGDVDVEALVPLIATRSQIDRLPRLPRPTMRRGVQLLLDRGPGLTPFSGDQDWLATQVRRVGGLDRVQVVEFFTAPNREGPIDPAGKPISVCDSSRRDPRVGRD